MGKNPLKAGVEYTYRFYNTSDVSAAREAYTLEKKYSCVERKVKFESIDPAGTNLYPITDEQVKITKSEGNGTYYVSVYVDEKEAGVWIDINDKTDNDYRNELYNQEVGGVEAFEYDPSHSYEIIVGKWWPCEDEDHKYYTNRDTSKTFTLGAANNISFEMEQLYDYETYTSYYNLTATWSGKKDSKYEVSFKAYDNKGAAVDLKIPAIADAKIQRDDFYNCLATVKLSDYIDLSEPTKVKTIKVVLKETAADGTVSESESEEDDIDADYTTYTYVNYLYVKNDSEHDEESGSYKYTTIATLYGNNLPDTAKLYYKKSWESFYNKVDLKKDADSGYLTATLPFDGEWEYQSYEYKAIVTAANEKWYDWYEGKTEEEATYSYYN